MTLIDFVRRYRRAIFLIIVLLGGMGAVTYSSLPVSIFPNLVVPRVIITASSGDTPVPLMLSSVTRPLESSVSALPGVTKLKSLTVRGNDELDVNFAWGTDMQSAMQLVNAKIAQVQPSLPSSATVNAEQLNPSVFPVMGYSLRSDSISSIALRRLASYTIRPAILRVPGVQQVTVMGGDAPDYDVKINPLALIQRGVTIADVETALAKANQVTSVGYYNEAYLRHDILVNGLFSGAGDIKAVTVAVKNGVPVTVGQISSVTPSIEPRDITASGDGHDAVLIDIIKQPSGNTIEIADGVNKALAIAKSQFPSSVVMSNYYDQSQIVRESQSSVVESILVGGFLALMVLMFFLGNLRSAIIVLIMLPLTILITVGIMKAIGQTLNIMTLGAMAIALGLVIDDGIVVVENIFHELENGRTRTEAISVGLKAITPAMLGSSITTMAAFLPLIFLKDLTGQFFGPLALVMIVTLGVSLFFALLVTPLLAQLLLPLTALHKTGKDDKPRPNKLTNFYGRALTKSLRNRTLVILCLVPVAIIALFVGSKLQTGFFPEFDEGGFILDYQLPDGTSLEQSTQIAKGIEQELAKTPEVAAWSRRTGAQLGFDITSQNVGDMSVRLKSDRRRSIDEIMADIRERVDGKYPQAQADFHQILQDNIGDIAGSPSPVEVKIFGTDQTVLETLAENVDDTITKVPGVVDDFDGIVHSGPETVVKVDTSRAQRYGLNADDISQAVTVATQGAEPTSVQHGEESIGVRVVLDHPASGIDANALANVPIESPTSGSTIPLMEVADVTNEPGASQVTRETQRQMIAVTAGISGRDLGSTTSDIEKAIAKNVKLPPGYSVEYGGQFESQQESFSSLALVLAIAVALVFSLLVIQLHSLRQSISLLLAAILSLVGVVLALFITGTQLNISSFTGSIMIVGIITENGIVLFDTFNRLRHENQNQNSIDLMIRAGELRLRPILMTTVGAILALFPLALGIGAGAAMQKPLAVAVIGGLCVSVIFTLIVAPALYIAMDSPTSNRNVSSKAKPVELNQPEY